jgi:hypothetical protein
MHQQPNFVNFQETHGRKQQTFTVLEKSDSSSISLGIGWAFNSRPWPYQNRECTNL